MISICILIASHNRKDLTLLCLKHIYESSLPSNALVSVLLVDDASSDGTTESVRHQHPEVEILQGTGQLFWTRAMHLGMAAAIRRKYDAYLWLNDDTFLNSEALESLFSIWQFDKRNNGLLEHIYVGSTLDPITRLTSYGGLRRRNWLKRFRFDLIEPEDAIAECDTMNGNFVLIPHSVATVVGNLDSCFEHAMGDIDFGLRARRLGFKIKLIPGHIGFCRGHEEFFSKKTAWTDKIKWIISPKGLPPRGWMLLVKRHGGLLWPFYFLQPYIRLLLRLHR